VIPLELGEVERLCRGDLAVQPGADRITGVQIDSRRVQPGDLFVAVGPGSGFVEDARARDAAATLVPDDPHAVLAALAGAVRGRSGAEVVGITGSTGKTSTKDILAALCAPQARMIAAEASFNAELGVPLTLCRLEPDTEICILELAMRGLGQIAELCAFARPTVGVITSIGPVHLELLGTVENVARAKAELLAALSSGAAAIVPAGSSELDAVIERIDLDLRRFGSGADSHVERWERMPDGARVRFSIRGRTLELALPVGSRHQAENVLAALLAYEALGLDLAAAQDGASAIRLSRWRGEETPLPGDGLLINDAYNANPMSMRAALADLADRGAGHRLVVVIGDMAELGADAEHYHREIGRAAEELGVSALVAVGPLARNYLDGARGVPVAEWAADPAQALEILERILEPGDCILVKASRSVGLEAVAEGLAAATA
jgi:UDP-N-acetylmuramoyl-tripeptide--D-alanyl-D-alanine ligase